jgi:hypothetical protein
MRPRQPRQRQTRGGLRRPVVGPAVLAHVVQGATLAGGVVVEHVLAGEAVGEPRAGGEEAPRRRPDRRLVPCQPRQLGAGRLARERRAAASQDLGGSEEIRELGDLAGGARVDAVEDGRTQRPPRGVGGHDAGAEAADADRGHVPEPSRQQLAAYRDEAVPPVALGILLGPARPRVRDVVRPHGFGQHAAAGPHEHALGARRPDVHAEEELAHGGELRPPAGRRVTAWRRGRPSPWRPCLSQPWPSAWPPSSLPWPPSPAARRRSPRGPPAPARRP